MGTKIRSRQFLRITNLEIMLSEWYFAMESSKEGFPRCFLRLEKSHVSHFKLIRLQCFAVNSSFWLLLSSTEESEIYSFVYEKDNNSKSPTILAKLLEILSNSHKRQCIGQVHSQEAYGIGRWTSFVKPCLQIIMFFCSFLNAQTRKHIGTNHFTCFVK